MTTTNTPPNPPVDEADLRLAEARALFCDSPYPPAIDTTDLTNLPQKIYLAHLRVMVFSRLYSQYDRVQRLALEILHGEAVNTLSNYRVMADAIAPTPTSVTLRELTSYIVGKLSDAIAAPFNSGTITQLKVSNRVNGFFTGIEYARQRTPSVTGVHTEYGTEFYQRIRAAFDVRSALSPFNVEDLLPLDYDWRTSDIDAFLKGREFKEIPDERIFDVISGTEVSRFSSADTFYKTVEVGKWINKTQYHKENTCPAVYHDHYHNGEHICCYTPDQCIEVFDINNYNQGSRIKPELLTPEVIEWLGVDTDYVENFGKIYRCEKTGKYYDFDISEYPFFVFGSGFTKTIDESRYTQIKEGLYVSNSSNPTMGYDTDVLEYFDGFLHEPYEEVTRGSKIHSKNTLFMGGELEVEMSRKATWDESKAAREAFVSMRGKAVVVHDGSLDEGFEIVSVPATLNSHYSMWEELCRGPIRQQIVSFLRSSCGLHIHMSKECFSNYTLGMFLTFINSSHNQDFITEMSGRGPNSYCARKPTKVSKAGMSRDHYADSVGHTHDKYVATNLRNPHTLEIRMFKGTLNYPSIMKAFEFLHSLHKYVTFNSAHNRLDFEQYLAWFEDKKSNSRRSYPYLWAFLVAKGRIKDRGEPLKASISTPRDFVVDNQVEDGTSTTTPPPASEEGSTDKRLDGSVIKLFQRSSNAARSFKLTN